MTRTHLESILIIQMESGIPLFHQQLDPRVESMDPALVSGFLFAVQAFSSEFVNRGSTAFHIDYGERLFQILMGQKVMFVLVSTGEIDSETLDKLKELLKEFETKWYIELETTVNSNLYEEFRSVVVDKLGIQRVSPNWVPYFETSDAPCAENKLAQLIDNRRTIREIAEASGTEIESVITELSRLWAIGVIGFRHMLEPNDVVIPTKELYKYLQTGASEHRQLQEFNKNLVSILPRVVPALDGRTTVAEIIQRYSEDTYDLLDYLLSKKAVELITHERKRILLAKELMQLTLDVAVRVYSKKVTIQILRESLATIERPEIIADLQVSDSDYKIAYGYNVFDGMTHEQLAEIHKDWLNILKDFIRRLPEKNKRRFVEEMVDTLQIEFFDKYSSEELDGVEQFTQELEELST